MSSILVTDILQELKEENERLLNELLYAKQCLKVLIEFKINFDFYSNKFKQSLEINEWKKFEKLNEEIIRIVFKLCGNRVNTNSDYITEDVIKTEETFNDNINDNSNERPIETTLESNEQVLNESINSGNSLINDNHLNDINREMNNEINFVQPIDKNSRDVSMNIIDSIQETTVFNPFFDESLQKSVISYIRRNNSLFNDILNEHLGQTSDQLVLQDVNPNEQNMRVKCDICDRSYSNKQSLSVHKSITHRKNANRIYRPRRIDSEEKYTLECDICHKKYSKIDSLQKHRINIHKIRIYSEKIRRIDKKVKQKKSFECDICHKYYTNKRLLRLHKLNIHKIKSQPNSETEVNGKVYFKCDLCESKYTNIKCFREHKKNKHDIKPRKKCPHCSKLILSDIRLKVHLNMHQNNGVFKCWHNGCDKEKYSETEAISHLNRHRVSQEIKSDPNKRFKYSCDWPGCDYKAKIPRMVESHKIYVHLPDSTSRRFACEHPGCDKKFKMKKDMTNHLATHSTERVMCEVCGKDYKTYVSLKSHIKSQHTKGETFVCDHNDCQYETNTMARLMFHKTNCHTIPTIACTFDGCVKKFTNKRYMKTHLISHNTELTHKCPIDGCDKAYKQKTKLNVHIKEKHTNIELYRCDWPGCDFQTNTRTSVKRHSNVHKTERDIICEWPECGKGFKNREQLKRPHKKTHE